MLLRKLVRVSLVRVSKSHGGKLTVAAKHADMDPKNFSDKMLRYGLRRSASAEPGEGGPRPA